MRTACAQAVGTYSGPAHAVCSRAVCVDVRGWSEYSVLDYSARSNDFFRYSKILDTRFCCIEYTRPDPILDIDTREYPSSISFMSKFMFLDNSHSKVV